MPHKQACPHCGAILTLPDSQSGRAVRCDHCQVMFLAPDFAPHSATPVKPLAQEAEHWPSYAPPERPLIELSEKTKKNLIYMGVALAAVLLVSLAIYALIEISLNAGNKTPGGTVVATPPYVPPVIAVPPPPPPASPPPPPPVASQPSNMVAAPPVLAPPTTTEVYSTLNDAQIGVALQSGTTFLLAQFKDGAVRSDLRENTQYGPGVDALCVYALLQSGMALHDPGLSPSSPVMGNMLDHLRDLDVDSKLTLYCTYARSLRISGLALAGRPEDRSAVDADLHWLLTTLIDGGYSYNETRPYTQDNSNSQYGLLGVWAAAEAGYPVPDTYWDQLQKFWNGMQRDDGTWGYNHGGPSELSMTAAGTASLFVTHDYLDPAKFGADVGRQPFSLELKRALDYLESSETELVAMQSEWDGYTAYGIERAGLASGFKFFGKTDWYRLIASDIIVNRLPGAIERKDVVNTCFYMLFLARGRHGIMMNKLRYDGEWANRPRDIANLSRFASHDLERQLNWHVVPVGLPWNEWFDASIIELSSSDRPNLSDDQIDNIRQYILNGGMLFMNADGGSKKFDAYAHELAAKLFPQSPMQDVPSDYFFYNIEYKIDKPPRLQYVTNGVRALIVYSPDDLTRYWQVRTDAQSNAAFEVGVNMFVTAAGKSDYRNGLETLYIPPAPTPPKEKIAIAQLIYNGNWNPEPGELPRFGRVLERDENIGVDVMNKPIGELKPKMAPLALWRGTDAVDIKDFTFDQAAGLRAYVEAGGVLLIEPPGGSRAFYDWIIDQGRAISFPGSKFKAIPSTHPLLDGKLLGSYELPSPLIRPFGADRPNPVNPHLLYFRYGKGAVIMAPLDLGSGLLGTTTWGIAGYTSEYSQQFMKNLVLWIRSGAHEPGEEN